jgi:hypothetical protein
MQSYYEALPIYRKASDLVVLLDRVVRGFPRYHKYTLGTRLRDTAIEVVLQVARCNARDQRAAALPRLCDLTEELKLLVNLGKEVEAFKSFGEYQQVMEEVVAVARQTEGWRRATSGGNVRRPEPPRPST